ncbi:MAG: hypothetical protein K2N94_07755, partial [Lachnospiraceae bacterium]|nr:hypothetical protein [Lachnospiraceae bacterium]
DLNPIAVKISQTCLSAVDPEVLNQTFETIRGKLQSVINRLYTVEENGEETLVTHTIWKDGRPLEVWYETKDRKKSVREGREIDAAMSENPAVMPDWYPQSEMYENSRINVGKGQRVCDLFTKRALVGLSLIAREIRSIEDVRVRNVFELTLSGTLSQASNLVFVIRRRKKNGGLSDRAEVGSWVVGYWVPEEHFEINVWNCFENRYRRILKGEKEINSIFAGLPERYAEENVTLFNGSATELPLEDDSVDYVFIDPPHSNRILYMEMSLMWNAWLQMESDIAWEKEIVVSEAKARNKTQENYHELLDRAFSEIHRVLKGGRFFSMAFNCLDDDTWLETLNMFLRYGFELCDIVPLEYSATSVIQDNRKNALKTDFVLTFKNAENKGQREITFQSDACGLENKIEQLLKKAPDAEVYHIMNALFAETIPEGYIYRVSRIVKKCAELMP